MRASVLALLAACGRIGFDTAAGDAPLPPDGDAGSCASEVETCNGIDDNCDGAIDEGCPCVPFDVTVSTTTPRAGPGFVWTGNGYAVTTDDGTSLQIQLIAADGTLGIASPVVPVGQAPGRDILAWDGARIAIAFVDGMGKVMLMRFDPATDFTSTPVMIAPSGTSPRVVRRGDRLGVTWGAGGIQLREVASDDTMTPPVMIAPGSNTDAMVATPAGYAVVVANGMPSLSTYDVMSGAMTAHSFILGGGQVMDLAASGAGFLATWRIVGASTVQRFDVAGVLQGQPFALPALPQSAAWEDLDVLPIAGGYRFDGISASTPHDLVTADVALDGSALAPAVAFGTQATGGGGTSFGSSATAAGRSALAQVFVLGGAPKVRVIQRCP